MIFSSVLQAIGLFLATNIDDINVLSLFFARGAGQRGTLLGEAPDVEKKSMIGG